MTVQSVETTRRRLPAAARAGLLVLDSMLGAVIGPLNFFGLVLFWGILLGASDPTAFLPRAFAVLLAKFALPEPHIAYMFSAPSLLSTALLAPFLIRFLESQASNDRKRYLWQAAMAGIIFGFVATFATGFFVGLAAALQIPEYRAAWPALGMGLGVSLLSGFLLNSMLAPAIAISGSLFGLMNGIIIRKVLHHGHRAA